jgi:ketosteroid isomerase-like protein
MFGTNSIDMNGPDGAPVRIHGRAVTIWRKDPDGEWRCAVDIWNAPPES